MLEGISSPYDSSLDGQQFLVLAPAPPREDAKITVLTNWQTRLRAR